MDWGRYLLSIFEKSASVLFEEMFYKQPFVLKSASANYESSNISTKKLCMKTIHLFMKFSCEVDLLWNRFAFNCVSVFANEIIFSHAYISKNLKSICLSNKKQYETANFSIKSSGELGSYQILSVLIVKIFVLI